MVLRLKKPVDADKNELREAIYKTILSTDEMYESEKPFEVKDLRKIPRNHANLIKFHLQSKSHSRASKA